MAAPVIPGVSNALLIQYRQEMQEELMAILSFWKQYTIDEEQGGFYGSVSSDNVADKSAPKGLVLNSRICWAFSAAFAVTSDPHDLQVATRAFDYLWQHFVDQEFGGVYWSVDAQGQMLDGRKQVYGQAFCIYGITEYYKVTRNESALQLAKELFHLIERHSRDHMEGGYIEAFGRDWGPATDLRLSDKDDNEKKTMNTHLHIIEAYANLYQVWPEREVKESILSLLDIFDKHFINKQDFHLRLFFDEQWQSKSTLQSYGHDIEAAWLLLNVAETIEAEEYIERYKDLAVKIAGAAAEGLDNDGGLWYEYEPKYQRLIAEKHSWPQAEAMIGFFNAWQLTGKEQFLDQSRQNWEFVKRFIRDKEKGEWLWGIKADYSPIDKDKAGFWKCPYHNTRACLELIRRTAP